MGDPKNFRVVHTGERRAGRFGKFGAKREKVGRGYRRAGFWINKVLNDRRVRAKLQPCINARGEQPAHNSVLILVRRVVGDT